MRHQLRTLALSGPDTFFERETSRLEFADEQAIVFE